MILYSDLLFYFLLSSFFYKYFSFVLNILLKDDVGAYVF